MNTTERTLELIALITERVKEIRSSKEWTAMLDANSRFWRYSFRNQLLIVNQKPKASRVASLQTWNKLKRSVRAGEKALYIFAPRLMGKKKAEQLAEKLDCEAAVLEGRLQGFHLCPVFDVSQTKGEDIPTVAHPLQGTAPDGMYAKLVAFAAEKGYKIIFTSGMGETNGKLDQTNTIFINNAIADAHAVKTLVHELAHGLLGHIGDKTHTRDQQELEAESCAWIVCRALGLDTDAYSFGYLAVWLRDHDADTELNAAGQRAANTAKVILTGLEAIA